MRGFQQFIFNTIPIHKGEGRASSVIANLMYVALSLSKCFRLLPEKDSFVKSCGGSISGGWWFCKKAFHAWKISGVTICFG